MKDLTPVHDEVVARAQRLYEKVEAPARLREHLEIVEGAAFKIISFLESEFDELELDYEAVLFGAATHDIGKARHPEELEQPGDLHEFTGEKILLEAGVPDRLARFARTHGRIGEESELEDVLVALADKLWKGKRDETLESLAIEKIADRTDREKWEVFAALDNLARDAYVGVEKTRWSCCAPFPRPSGDCEYAPKMRRPHFRGLTGCEYVPIMGKIGTYSHFDLFLGPKSPGPPECFRL
jgi:hypothetical protein